MSLYIKDLNKDTRLVEFAELADQARNVAMTEVVECENKALREKIKAKKDQIKNKLHLGINNKDTFRAIKNALIFRKKLLDCNYCVKVIKSNVCMFTEEGHYVTYAPPRV